MSESNKVGTGSHRLTLSVPPSLNRKYINRSFTVSNEYRSWKNQTGLICKSMRMTPFEGNCSMYIVWYRARKAGDIDSKLKIILDSLEGYTYLNDKQVSMLCIERREDKENPRVEILVTDLDLQNNN